MFPNRRSIFFFLDAVPNRRSTFFFLGASLGLGLAAFLFAATLGKIELSDLSELNADDIQVIRIGRGQRQPLEKSTAAPITDPAEFERLLRGLRGAERVRNTARPRLRPLLRLHVETKDGAVYAQRFFADDAGVVYVEAGLEGECLRSLELSFFADRALD